MPEVGIGFFPDVGATWFLPRLPHHLGTYLALTGERMKPADALAAGIATHYVPSVRLPALLEKLTRDGPVHGQLIAFAAPLGLGVLSPHLGPIDRLFSGETVEHILAALDAEAVAGGEAAGFAGATAAVIRGKSPTSLKIALAQMRRGRNWSFSECMTTEFRIVSRIVYGHDFYEGVRAVIIDKDNAPRWKPATLAEVSTEEVERHFAPLEHELDLP
jgi:enoyl-CoA hydratase